MVHNAIVQHKRGHYRHIIWESILYLPLDGTESFPSYLFGALYLEPSSGNMKQWILQEEAQITRGLRQDFKVRGCCGGGSRQE